MAEQTKSELGRSEVERNARAQAAMSVEIFLRLLGHAKECSRRTAWTASRFSSP